MAKIDLSGLQVDIPENWQVQGMVTLTLPSDDPKIKPNVILTRENLPKPMDLATYFEKIKEAIARRNIKDFEILEERELTIAGQKAMTMVCKWDVGAMKQMMQNRGAPSTAPAPSTPQEPQIVKQIQVTMLKDEKLAVNITASFPAEQFETYNKPFLGFLKSLKIS